MRTLAAPIVIACLLCAGCSESSPRGVARAYCRALSTGNYESYKSLFEERRQKLFPNEMLSIASISAEIVGTSSYYFDVKLVIRVDGEDKEYTASVYLYPGGKIKYDAYMCGHPALGLRGIVWQMEHPKLIFRQGALTTIKLWKLPRFEFDPEGTPEERAESIKKMREWVAANVATFDSGPVKLPLSPIDLKRAREPLPEDPLG